MCVLYLRQDFSESILYLSASETGMKLVGALGVFLVLEGVMKAPATYFFVLIFALVLFLEMQLFPCPGLGNCITTKGEELSENKTRQNKCSPSNHSFQLLSV